MAIASEIMYSAATIAGIIGAGETPTTDETAVMLARLQRLLDSWSAEELTMFSTRTASITLSSGTVSYAISGARPVKVLSADAVVGGIGFPVEVVGPDGFAAFPGKSDTSAQTKVVMCDYAFPTPNAIVGPIPGASGVMNLYCTVALPTLAAVGTTLSAPEGYLAALEWSLAVELCPAFGRAVDPTIAAIANQRYTALKNLNASNRAGKSTLAVPPLEGK